MDLGDPSTPTEVHLEPGSPAEETPRKLPDDLPTSLDDRRSFPTYGEETEMYDGWQGKECPTRNKVVSWFIHFTYVHAPCNHRLLPVHYCADAGESAHI